MPDFDQAFPEQPATGGKDFDALFPAQVEQPRQAGVVHSPIQDMIFGDASVNPVARVLNAFGEGAQDGWGTDKIGLSDESKAALEKTGQKASGWLDQQGTLVKAANQALIRPAAQQFYRSLLTGEFRDVEGLAEGAYRGLGALFRGGQAAVQQTFAEFGAPRLGREIAALPEAFLTEIPGVAETAEAARQMGIIGRGEAGWKGTAPVETPVKQPAPTTPAPAPLPAPTVHDAARAAQPTLFSRYDPLIAQRDSLQTWINEQKTEGFETPAAAKSLAEINRQIDELAPEVAQAYRVAARNLGTPTVATPQPQPAQFTSTAEMLAARGEVPSGAASVAGAAGRSLETQRAFISGDVERQLIAAGRPADEAKAAGAIIAERYVTRAARFNGALGAPEELYSREAPEIRGQGGSAPAAREEPPRTPGGATIDATHDVISGANSTTNGTIVIDRRIPQLSPILKDAQGNPANLHKYLAVHERIEAQGMADGLSYDQAHQRATAAEREQVEADGVDWKKYTLEIDGYLDKIEHEKVENPPPGQMHVDPQVALGHHRVANKAAEEAKPVPVPVGPARGPAVAANPSLLQFLAMHGGIRSDDALINDLRQSFGGGNKFVPGLGQLIRPPKELSTAATLGGRKGPMSLDEARRAAVEAGYLVEPGEITSTAEKTTIDDLLQAIDREARGQRVYRQGHEPLGTTFESGELEKAKSDLSESLNEYVASSGGTPLTAAESARALEIWQKEGITDHAEILERLALEGRDAAIEAGPVNAGEPFIHGWDDNAFARGHAGTGELAAPTGGQPEGAAGGATVRGGSTGERPQDLWRGFLDQRLEPGQRRPIAKGFNDFRTRSGMAPLRDKANQEWSIGNVVNVGIVKDLLITKANADGTFTLLGKPNDQGISRSYITKPHAGITRDKDVNFVEVTQHLQAVEQDVDEYFQRRRETEEQKQARLIREREAEGQQSLFGRMTPGEVAQRRANEPLKPTVEQKPMDIGLFGDEKNQEELFQRQLGKIRLGGERPIITLAKSADASTFIHETGHAWLEELMRDAEHPQAPDVLKSDAQTVRDWLGVDSSADIKTRHHEKFARGFEQYVREGVAPTPRLAAVFAKFRDWLLQIYNSLRGLGAEITPEIRSVFDRLLSTEPERTVIAPDLAKSPTLQDIHRVDADVTPPHQAEGAADRIVNEADRYKGGLPGDIIDEHRGSAAEGTTRGSESGALPEAGGTPEPVIPSGIGGKEPGHELPSGGETLPESPAARIAQGGAGEIKPLPIGPHVPTDSMPVGQMDKVGNIRLENLNTPADVNEAIRALYRDNRAMLDAATRGRVSDQAIVDLADAMGSSPALVANNMERLRAMTVEDGVPLGARIWLLRDTFTKLATEVQRLAQGDDVKAYAEAKQRFLMAHETLSGITAEMGRGLRAFRAMTGVGDANLLATLLKQDTGKTLFQLRQEMALVRAAETPAQAAQMVNGFAGKWQRIRSGIISYVVNNLISGPVTHATYYVGNVMLGLWRAVPMTAAAALRDTIAAQYRALDPADRVYFREITARLYGMGYGQIDGFGAAMNALKTGVSLMKGDASGLDLFAGETAYRPQAIPGRAGYVLETPSRAVAAIHTLNYAMNYEAEISAMAVRDAFGKGLEPGSDAFNRSIAEFRQNPSEAAITAAHDTALEYVLMRRAPWGSFQQKLQSLVNSNLFLKLLAPFMQIGTNILKGGFIESTPLAFLSQSAREDLLGRNGRAAQSMRYSQMMVGTGLAMGTFGLAWNGIISGGGPSDPKAREVLEMTGWKPYSIRIGEHWIPYRKYLSVLGPLVAGVADMAEIGHAMSDKGLANAAAALAMGFSEVVLDETWMRGISELVNAATHWDRDGEKWLRNMSMDFLPFASAGRQIASLTDPVWREVRSEMDALLAHIPGASKQLFPVRDIWGNPSPGGVMVAPSAVIHDPATDALLKAEYYPARIERKIRGVQLTDQQYDDLTRIAGRDAYMHVSAMVRGNPGWDSIPQEFRQTMLESAVESARERARQIVMMQNKSIFTTALANKHAAFKSQAIH